MIRLSRRAAAAAVVALTAAALTGCSAGSGDSGGPVELTVWANPNSIGGNVEKNLAAEFPDWKITVSKIPDIADKLQTGLRANTGLPDVAIIGGFPDYFKASSKFLDLSEYGFKDTGQYISWGVKSGQDLQGRQIGLPTDIGPTALFYRADAMEALGYPSDPDEVASSLNDFASYQQLAEKAKADGKFVVDWGSSVYRALLLQAGYGYVEQKDGKLTSIVDDDVNQQAFSDSASLLTNDLSANVQPYTPEWNSAIAQDSLVAFIGPSWEEGILKPAAGADSTEWRVTEPPGGATASAGSYSAAFASTKHPKEAAQVAQYLASDEALKDSYLTKGLFPPAVALYSDPDLAKDDPFYGGQNVFSRLGDIADEAPFTFFGPGGTVLLTQFGDALTSISTEGGDPAAKYDALVEKYRDFTG